jgi:hypothetical protein
MRTVTIGKIDHRPNVKVIKVSEEVNHVEDLATPWIIVMTFIYTFKFYVLIN